MCQVPLLPDMPGHSSGFCRAVPVCLQAPSTRTSAQHCCTSASLFASRGSLRSAASTSVSEARLVVPCWYSRGLPNGLLPAARGLLPCRRQCSCSAASALPPARCSPLTGSGPPDVGLGSPAAQSPKGCTGRREEGGKKASHRINCQMRGDEHCACRPVRCTHPPASRCRRCRWASPCLPSAV